MLTIRQVRKIVSNCIRRVTRVARSVDFDQRLVDFGINSEVKLKRFKLMIVRDVSRRGNKIALSDLSFGQNAFLGMVSEILSAMTLEGGTPKIPSSRRSPGIKLRAKAAKKRAAKKMAKRAKPEAKNGRGIEMMER